MTFHGLKVMWDFRSLLVRLLGIFVFLTFPVWWVIVNNETHSGLWFSLRCTFASAYELIITGNPCDD